MVKPAATLPANHSHEGTILRNIQYLSAPAAVRMADQWFAIAAMDHFWIRRRFDVLQRLAGGLIPGAREMAEIGCGNGLLQRQIEEAYGREVTGFDLNEFALRQNLSQISKVCCYDIYQENAALRERFDLIFLFDVLEHMTDEDRFFKALMFHLVPSGKVVVNVPAGNWAYSAYDEAAGHVRRYSIATLGAAAGRNDLEVTSWSYWGLPLVPALALRKLWLMGNHDQKKIISAGFDTRTPAINGMLRFLSRCEWIPQKFLGTSLMAVLQTRRGSR
jgi:2-polyprenyl-3-methyl-5-hydroxy-6-metoxy-1,4-benzoquinol methylase